MSFVTFKNCSFLDKQTMNTVSSDEGSVAEDPVRLFTGTNFMVEEGFCADCGTILPLLDSEFVNCFVCKKRYNIDALGKMHAEYTIHFNNLDKYLDKSEAQQAGAEGPIVERKCPKCGNETMSYATLQLRSADEGQTVFYTCTQCKYKETENS